jgi:quercetin dioxygenase-like cupin family protein
MHTHTGDCEIIYILSGKGKVLVEGGAETLLPGDAHYCPEGSAHALQNDGDEDLCFFSVIPKQ